LQTSVARGVPEAISPGIWVSKASSTFVLQHTLMHQVSFIS